MMSTMFGCAGVSPERCSAAAGLIEIEAASTPSSTTRHGGRIGLLGRANPDVPDSIGPLRCREAPLRAGADPRPLRAVHHLVARLGEAVPQLVGPGEVPG